MKKILSLATASLLCISAFAQTKSEPTSETVFAPYWFIQGQVGGAYTIGEAKFSKLISPTAALSFGYQFNPIFRLRVGASGWESKGGWTEPDKAYQFNYVAANADAMFNLTNLISGWKPERVFNLYAFVGLAWNHGFNNDGAKKCKSQLYNNGVDYEMPYLWSTSDLCVGRAGLMADFRLSKHFDANIEANANVTSDHYNSKRANNPDWYFNCMAGVTYRVGSGSKTIERPVLEPEIINVHDTVVVEKVIKEQVKGNTIFKQDIFFDLAKSNVKKTEEYKVEEIANYLKANPTAKVTLVGYADVQTGNPEINKKYADARSAEVAKELIEKYGIAADRISTDSKGDTVQPFRENDQNRVTMCIAE